MNELQAGVELFLTALNITLALVQPGKGSLCDPARRGCREGVQLMTLGDLHRLSKFLLDRLGA